MTNKKTTVAHTEVEALYKNILQNMRDGVLTISLEGRILTFNQAAADIFKFDKNRIIGKNFSELFFSDPRNDEFNDVILKAIYDSSVTHHKEVPYYLNNELKTLLISATFLFLKESNDNKKLGIIIVISDLTKLHQLNHIQELFGRYIDPHIATRLIDLPKESFAKPKKQNMTVSFCDMRNFTTMCEILPANTLVKLMNSFLSYMSQPVHRNNGVIDKFIGDATMAFWGYPFTTEEDHAVRACQTAIEQCGRTTELNKQAATQLRTRNYNFSLRVNIGIATGNLVVGNIGSKEFKSYTIMGNAVNLASRLVGVNKTYGTSILICEKTAKSANTIFETREIDKIHVQGKEEITYIYELLGHKNSLDKDVLELRNTYQLGLERYRNRDWKAAHQSFENCLKISRDDKPSLVFLKRIEYFKKQPPPEDWDGIWHLTKKR